MLIFSDRFNQRLEDFFKAVKKQSRQNLSKGTKLQRKKRPINKTKKLYNSIQYKKLFENNDSLAYGLFMEDYGDYIDKGVKGTKSNYRVNKNTPYKYTTKKPPPLIGYAKDAKLKFRYKKGSGRGGQFMSYKTMGFILRESIFQKGIRANNFFTIPFVNEFKKLPNDLQDIFADDFVILMIDSMIEAGLIKRGN